MLRSVELDDPVAPQLLALRGEEPGAVVPVVTGIDPDGPPLPRDHPPWPRDAIALSNRARALFARAKPIVLRVLTFWDHRVRSILIAGRRVSVDPSGCYRIGSQ